ncbi:hypothetical protein EV356DRAFT_497985 [Viridothelium virens]|uniref:Uncharacterized protein n=1 Tax=Viridothelium virens TaxID=1048519 RepID=A0A6A6GS54_VIRVR|nr:hypothetical protein EV356DRAFT_497985 [Viridothelium virens]
MPGGHRPTLTALLLILPAFLLPPGPEFFRFLLISSVVSGPIPHPTQGASQATFGGESQYPASGRSQAYDWTEGTKFPDRLIGAVPLG